MSAAIRKSITDTFGFEPICINSALVSAQNRQRLYWVGKRNKGGTYDAVEVYQPVDKHILLSDVINECYITPIAYRGRDYNGKWTKQYESRRDGKANAITTATTDSMVAVPVNTTCEDKSQTIKHQYQQTSIANIVCYSSTYGATGVAEMVSVPINTTSDGKSCTIRATCYKDGIRNLVGNDVDRKTCVAEFVPMGAIPVKYYGDIPVKAVSLSDGKEYTVYYVTDGMIEIKGRSYPIKLQDGYYIIRKLTVRECMKLQTVPDWYDFSVVSDSQAYKMLGNGWTCDVITHLITATLNA